MKILPSNHLNNINFSSRNKNIRRADDIQRAARNTFPVLSPSYIDEFYLSTKMKNEVPVNMQARTLFKKADNKLTALRTVSKAPEKYGLELMPYEKETPYAHLLNGMELLKIGNCEECAVAALAALTANGYYNSQRVSLGMEIQYVDKKTGKIEYKEIEPLDHSFVITSLDNENPKEKDKIVVDPWMGFTDSVSGAKARFKQIYGEKELHNIFSYHRSMFRVNMAMKTGNVIDYNDYELRSNFIFYPSDMYTKEDLKDLGLYARIMYSDLVRPTKKD